MTKMRRSDRAMTEIEAREFLHQQAVGRLGLVAHGEPYVVPLNYVVLDGDIYFHGAREGLKMEAMRHNPRVCFLVDEFIGVRKAARACDFSVNYRSVIARGSAQVVEDADAKGRILNALTRKYAGGQDFEPVQGESARPTAVVQIRVDSISGKQVLPG